MYWNSRMSREASKYLRKLVEEAYTERYIAQHRGTLCSFQKHCQALGIGTVSKVRAEHVLSFIQKYKNHSGSYQALHWVILRRFLAFYKNPALLDVRPQIHGTARTRVDWLTPEECEAVFRTPMTPKESMLIGAGLLQGLRRVETLRMTVRDARDALRTSVLRVRGKGGKERAIPLQDEFSMILRSYLVWADPSKEDEKLLPMGRTVSEKYLARFCVRNGRRFTFTP